MPPRPLLFTNHALQRMNERGVTPEDVVSAMRRPAGDPRPGSAGNHVVVGYASGGRLLRVVFASDGESVVTVIWVSS
ncbi:unannotated protein [freshwater metagenome]|uniref:Unannotated protein n=1 Tax=freshwater metagenome TaxID=449393 RepID=A0A6J7GMV1_9ZZZZ|nr:DUF4258 domain-containing protein [Actinomycetota bacterium]